jgi:hypothetical protein
MGCFAVIAVYGFSWAALSRTRTTSS